MALLARLPEDQPNDPVTEAFETEVRRWSARIDNFCRELEGKGFGVERDGLTVRIKTPAPGGSEPQS